MVDDESGHRELIGALIARSGQRVHLEEASNVQQALEQIARRPPDLMILDLHLGPQSGLDVLRRMRSLAQPSRIATVVLTAMASPELARRALELGAQDFLDKEELDATRLQRTVTYALERHRSQMELLDTRLRMKERFLSHVSHELRTPLDAIYQFTTLIRDEVAGPITEQQREFLDVVVRNTDQQKSMVDDLLDLTRAGSGKLALRSAPLDLGEAARSAVQNARPRAEKAGVTLRLFAPAELPTALADATRVAQVLSNLIDNALKFTPRGGEVDVSLRADAEDLVIDVRDTGYGIPAAEQHRVFEQLYQVDRPSQVSRNGLGIGLFLCRELVGRMNGRMELCSQPGTGSTFTVRLPTFELTRLIESIEPPEGSSRQLLGLGLRWIGSDPGKPEDLGTWIDTELASRLIAAHDRVLCRLPSDARSEVVLLDLECDAAGAEAVSRRLGEELRDAFSQLAGGELTVIAAHATRPAGSNRDWFQLVSNLLEDLHRDLATLERPA